MNKKLLFTLGIIVLVILGYFALQKDTPPENAIQLQEGTQSHGMDQMSEGALELVNESVVIPFKESYSIDEEWSLIVNQFEPNAKIMGTGMISSDSDQEQNPAIKVDFYKNGELVHYQIVFKDMPGFHSVKPGQKYLLDFIDYKGFKVLGSDNYSIESANLKIWRIK